jgi:hypothetical protein
MTYSTVAYTAIGTDYTENTIPLLLFMGCFLVTASCCDSTILALSEYATISSSPWLSLHIHGHPVGFFLSIVT